MKAPYSDAGMSDKYRPLKPETRWWLYFDSLLVLVAGIQLFVLSDQTDRYFAWTINPPITAAFLGASYWGGLALVLLSARERIWAYARPSIPSVWLFSTLTLVATILHLDRFHMNSAFGWIWLVVYIVIPFLLPLLFARQQLRGDLADPPHTNPLPTWLRVSLAAQAVILITLGAMVFVAPQTAGTLWPWTLTPLTGRAVAAWLIGIGCVAANALWEGDLRRVRVAMISSTVLGLLHCLVVARHAWSLDWNKSQLWVYTLFVLLFTVSALLGWRASQQTAGIVPQGQPSAQSTA